MLRLPWFIWLKYGVASCSGPSYLDTIAASPATLSTGVHVAAVLHLDDLGA